MSDFFTMWNDLNNKAAFGGLTPEDTAYLQQVYSNPDNRGSTYVQGINIPIGEYNRYLAEQGLSVEMMMRARDAANGGVMAYDPTKSEWDASVAAKIAQVAKGNTSTGVSPQQTANIAKANAAISLPAGTSNIVTAKAGGQSTTESGYNPLTLVLGAVLFVLLIVMFAGSAIKRGVSHGV
jgi:type V secretory pathway adhesin AidA